CAATRILSSNHEEHEAHEESRHEEHEEHEETKRMRRRRWERDHASGTVARLRLCEAGELWGESCACSINHLRDEWRGSGGRATPRTPRRTRASWGRVREPRGRD